MGVGPNYVLDKGHVATGSAAYKAATLVVSAGDGTQIANVGTAGVVCRGVVMETCDVAKVTTGKAVLDVRMLGIARVIAGTGGVSVDSKCTVSATGTAVKVGTTAATVYNIVGIALTAAAAGAQFDMLLTPGLSATTPA
jgi:hypothetical protein